MIQISLLTLKKICKLKSTSFQSIHCFWTWYLTDFALSQNAAQGHFILRNYAWIETHAQLLQKTLGPFSIPHIMVPQLPRYKLSPAKQILPREDDLLGLGDSVYQQHLPDTNVRQHLQKKRYVLDLPSVWRRQMSCSLHLQASHIKLNIFVQDTSLDVVDSFVYPGSFLSTDRSFNF